MATKKPKGLGRGLEALLGPTAAPSADNGNGGNSGSEEGGAQRNPTTLMLDQMVAGVYQPRTRMDEGALYELAESIKAQGIMQPILVRRLDAESAAAKNAEYEIIAGERRFRAARLAGLDSVPVLVRDVPNEAAAAMSLIENIQREDLNPLEEAQGLQRLVNEFGLTHEQAAQAVGRSRSAASNLLRLLNLAEPRTADADGRRHRHGPCPRAAVAGPWHADHGGQPDCGQEDVGARSRGAGQEARGRVRRSRPRAAATTAKSRATCSAWKKNWPTCSPPRSRCASRSAAKRGGRIEESGELAIHFGSIEALNGLIERIRRTA